MNVAFVLNDIHLSGGVATVLRHAHNLSRRHGIATSLVVLNPSLSWDHKQLADLPVLSVGDAAGRRFDIAVATWWETVYALSDLDAKRYAHFVQSLEDRFYEPEYTLHRIAASLTYDLPLFHITEALWIADFLDALHGDRHTLYVRNGVDKETFCSPTQLNPRSGDPLRILIEGRPSAWFKGVEEALRAVDEMAEPSHVTVVTGEDLAGRGLSGVDRALPAVDSRTMASLYREADLLLKLSRVEGMAGPPLEAFHLGATAVMTPVSGHDEYAVHGWNSLIVDFDDLYGTAKQLDLLGRDRRYLHYLRTNALATARTWPSWEHSSQFFALALQRIASTEPPPVTAATRQLFRDVAAALDSGTTTLAEFDPAFRLAQRLRRLYRHPALAPLRPLTQRLARRMTR